MPDCRTCGVPLRGEPMTCPECGKRRFVMNLESGAFSVTGKPIGMTVEGDPEDPAGRRLDSKPASGGESLSTIDVDGKFHIQLSGSLEAGRPGEWHVLKTLIKALEAAGADVTTESGEKDDRGEDALLQIDGERTPVQVTTIPTDVWKPLANDGEVILENGEEAAVSLVREALLRKSISGAGTLLALDATHVGVLVKRSLVDRYLEAYGDPGAEFQYRAVWIIGPTPRSSIRVG